MCDDAVILPRGSIITSNESKRWGKRYGNARDNTASICMVIPLVILSFIGKCRLLQGNLCYKMCYISSFFPPDYLIEKSFWRQGITATSQTVVV